MRFEDLAQAGGQLLEAKKAHLQRMNQLDPQMPGDEANWMPNAGQQVEVDPGMVAPHSISEDEDMVSLQEKAHLVARELGIQPVMSPAVVRQLAKQHDKLQAVKEARQRYLENPAAYEAKTANDLDGLVSAYAQKHLGGIAGAMGNATGNLPMPPGINGPVESGGGVSWSSGVARNMVPRQPQGNATGNLPTSPSVKSPQAKSTRATEGDAANVAGGSTAAPVRAGLGRGQLIPQGKPSRDLIGSNLGGGATPAPPDPKKVAGVAAAGAIPGAGEPSVDDYRRALSSGNSNSGPVMRSAEPGSTYDRERKAAEMEKWRGELPIRQAANMQYGLGMLGGANPGIAAVNRLNPNSKARQGTNYVPDRNAVNRGEPNSVPNNRGGSTASSGRPSVIRGRNEARKWEEEQDMTRRKYQAPSTPGNVPTADSRFTLSATPAQATQSPKKRTPEEQAAFEQMAREKLAARTKPKSTKDMADAVTKGVTPGTISKQEVAAASKSKPTTAATTRGRRKADTTAEAKPAQGTGTGGRAGRPTGQSIAGQYTPPAQKKGETTEQYLERVKKYDAQVSKFGNLTDEEVKEKGITPEVAKRIREQAALAEKETPFQSALQQQLIKKVEREKSLGNVVAQTATRSSEQGRSIGRTEEISARAAREAAQSGPRNQGRIRSAAERQAEEDALNRELAAMASSRQKTKPQTATKPTQQQQSKKKKTSNRRK